MRTVTAIVLAAALGISQVMASDGLESEVTREAMQLIFDNLRVLLRLDASGEEFDNPENATAVLEALRELDDQAAILASHGFYEDTGGMYLASVLERYTLLLLRTYERGEAEQVQRLLYGITDICIACHARLPSAEDSSLAGGFVDSQALASLPLSKKAKIQVATRRFDDALATLEMQIESAESMGPAALEDALRTYLIVNIRVKGDMERPIPVVEIVAERSAPHSAWRRDVELWLDSLEHLRDRPFIGDPLESARAIVASAGSSDFPSQRSALVEYIAASSLLHRFLVSKPSEAMEISEAHYLLGLAEYRIHPDEWLPHAELYLEIAIVLAPDAKWALPAYTLLVEKLDQTYQPGPEGSLPLEVEERLRELRQAIDGIQPSSARSRERVPTALIRALFGPPCFYATLDASPAAKFRLRSGVGTML